MAPEKIKQSFFIQTARATVVAPRKDLAFLDINMELKAVLVLA
jgi:hypothetical protein